MNTLTFFDFTSEESERTRTIRRVTFEYAAKQGYCGVVCRQFARTAPDRARWSETPDDVARRVVPAKSARATQREPRPAA